MSGNVRSEWHGEEFGAGARVALGRGLVAIAEHVVIMGKQNADVITGTMRRSIHSAPANYDGSGDEDTAKGADMQNAGGTTMPTQESATTQVLEVGSWVPYACVEETVRGHQFMTPAVTEMQGARANAIMIQAFREEGMSVRPL